MCNVGIGMVWRASGPWLMRYVNTFGFLAEATNPTIPSSKFVNVHSNAGSFKGCVGGAVARAIITEVSQLISDSKWLYYNPPIGPQDLVQGCINVQGRTREVILL